MWRLLLLGIFCWMGCQPINVPPGAPKSSSGEHKYIEDLSFSHKKHAAHEKAPEKCGGCHKQGRFRMPLMAFCVDCHSKPEIVTQNGLMENCRFCHEKIETNRHPEWPWHYGKRGHKEYSERPVIYCAYCHTKNPEAFPIKNSYAPFEACKGCHIAEGRGPVSFPEEEYAL